MSKPSEQEEEAAPAFASPPKAAPLNVGSVADLERRLAEMGSQKKATPPPAPAPVFAQAPVPTVSAPAPAAAVKGGKNALLARIMAAKEKQKAAKEKTPSPPPPASVAPPPSADLLSGFDEPSTNNLPPPAYETNFLKDAPPPAFDAMVQQQQQPQMAPPAFNTMVQQQQMQFPPPPPIDSVLPPPPPLDDVLPPPPMPEGDLLDMGMPSAPTATAPMFEDLHMQQPQQQEFHPPPLPPPMEAAPPELDIDESILNALEPAEREAFLEEQKKIMEQIEREKSDNEASSATARAMAFDQRSSSAVANVAASYEGGGRSSSSRSRPSSGRGPTVNLGGDAGEVAVRGAEETQRAIEDGTAVIVNCLSCDQWMQVTEAAELMYCPICASVCPVEKKGAAKTSNMEAAAQLAADMELAQKLQNEEYEGAQHRRSRRSQSQQSSSAAEESTGKGWFDWLTGSTTAPAPATRSAPTSGISTRSSPSSSGGGGLVSAQTGEESRGYGSGTNIGGARVAAPQKSMFSCVADSMNTAVTQMYTFNADEEGNVHGVDSQGLLAMPDVSRQREN